MRISNCSQFRKLGSGIALLLLLPVSFTSQAGPCEVDRPATAQTFPCGVLATGTSPKVLAEIGRSAGARIKHEYERLNVAAFTVPNASIYNRLQSLSSLRLFPDRPVEMHAPPEGKGKGGNKGGGSTGEVTPEGIERIGGPGTASDIGVAIVDTGIDLNNQDLTVGSDTFDAYGGDGTDLNGHGTHVSGIVAAIGNNGIDVIGVVPDATVYAVRVLDERGSGFDSDIIGGLDWVLVNHNSVVPNISVVNMSLGRSAFAGDFDPGHPMRAAVKALTDQNIVVVVSAGNTATKEINQLVPAGYPEVLAIASTTAQAGDNKCRSLSNSISADTASYFTTDGAGVAISAPGETSENVNRGCILSSNGILSLQPGGGTVRMSGTSMASPHVAGVVAALKHKNNNFTTGQIRQCFANSAQLTGSAPLDSPVSSYSFDGVREGIAYLPKLLQECN